MTKEKIERYAQELKKWCRTMSCSICPFMDIAKEPGKQCVLSLREVPEDWNV